MQQRFAILISAASLALSAACSRSDTGITTAVKAKLAADDTVKASEVNVDAHDHVVTLNGTVATNSEKQRAGLIARDTKGVTSVIDDLVVGPVPAATSGSASASYGQKAEDSGREAKAETQDAAHDAKVKTERAAGKTGEVLTDAAITAAVKTKFLAESGVPGTEINVDTTNGVVTLTGTLKNKAEANKAMMIARNSKGVKRVVNHLKVG